MATTDNYGQGVSVATLTDPPDAETLAKNIANAIVSRSAMRFASAATRAATLVAPLAAPVAGMITYLTDVRRHEYYDGTGWFPLRGQSASSIVTSGSPSTTTEVTTGATITLPTRAGARYELEASCLARSSNTGDRIELRIRRGTTPTATQVGGGSIRSALAGSGDTLTGRGIDTPGAGNTTWTVYLARGSGTGTVEVTASTALPCVFTVREV
ncbi:hypothetical protein AB0E67_16815 [Streptomyces sp. NPDC032161]|uniref:hypothetical protein n=1 Tax=unclassified Streptomyces TaxID=2593676 RepID=UPI00340310A6